MFARSAAAIAPFALATLLMHPSVAGVLDAPPTYSPVSTLAGTGAAGVADGPAASAQFMFPTGVAEDAAGTIYVADFAAQRIRKIARDGTVTTLAGGGQPDATGLWVNGDRVDGPARAARFYGPAGVAVDAHGTVYVADGVHVVRKIENGIVSRFAGTSDEGGSDRLGSALGAARFSRPVGLAVDSDGDVYVADIVDGVREVTKDGNVIAPPFASAVEHPSAISIWDSGGVRSFAIADKLGILYVSPKRENVRIAIDPDPQTAITHGNDILGYPAGIAMTGPHSFVFTDPRTNTIRTWSAGETRIVAGQLVEDAEHRGGGYRDGPGEQAMFNAPIGIVRDASGGFVVADAGNRRIRKLGPFDTRGALDPTYGEIPQLLPGAKHVLLIGNSFTAWDAPWRDSMGGRLEQDLNSDGPHPPVQVIAVRSGGLTTQAQEQFIAEVCADLPIDYAIFVENSSTAVGSYPPPPGTVGDPWVDPVAADLRKMAAELPKPQNVVVLIHPYAWEFSPSETTYHRLFFKYDGEFILPTPSFHQGLRDSVAKAGLPLIDLWTDLERAEASSDREPYFATNEPHFSFAGNRLAADAIARYMTADPKWKRVIEGVPGT